MTGRPESNPADSHVAGNHPADSHPDSVEVRFGWVVVLATLLISSIAQGAPNVLFVTLKSIAGEFGWPRAVPSGAFALMMIGSGVGGLFMGWWMDKRGVLQPVLFGSVMIALGALIASRAEGRFSLYLANGLFIGMLGEAAMIAPLIANVTRWFDRRRGLAVAIVACGQAVAGAVWPPVAQMLNEAVGWRDTYLFFSVFTFATLVPLVWLLRRRPPESHYLSSGARDLGSERPLGLAPRMVQGALCLASVGCCTAMAMPMVHLISHATDLGYSAGEAARLFSALFVTAFFGRLCFGMLADRIGGVATLMLASSIQAAGLLGFVFVDSLLGLYLVAAGFGIGFAGIMLCYPLIIRMWFPAAQAGRRIAALFFSASIGMATGGWLGGAIFDFTGAYAYAFLTGFAFNLMNLAVIGLLFARQTRLGLRALPG